MALDVAFSARKFTDPDITVDGSQRAKVSFTGLETLWVNTGTLCNIACAQCYIESSPTNDRLVYLTLAEFEPYLAEARQQGAWEIGFTGGEPFMNPDAIDMITLSLEAGMSVLVLTNAMKPMRRPRIAQGLTDLRRRFGARLKLRVSLDHFGADLHDKERGDGSFEIALSGLRWLAEEGFAISVAGRAGFAHTLDEARNGFQLLFDQNGLNLSAHEMADLVLFPEMDEQASVPEISEGCWEKLSVSPDAMMCASARMLVKRKGADRPSVLACTLLPYDERFELGSSLTEATQTPVSLNHPHCAKFCVLGGASCSG